MLKKYLLFLVCLLAPGITQAQGVNWQLMGPITPMTATGLPTAGAAGTLRSLSDGASSGALVIDDGTNWNCLEAKSQHIQVVTCPPFNAKGDGTTNDSQAFRDAIGTGAQTVMIPPGTFIINNVYFKTGTRILGSGVGSTILKLPDNTISSVLVNPATPPLFDVEIAHLTIDGNAENQTNPGVAAFGSNGISRFWFHDLHIKNSIEYCIGLEHGTHQGKISDVVIENCRWDGIDIKNANNDSRVEITNVSVHNPGANFGTGGVSQAVCFDQGGVVKLSNVRCTGLTGDRYGFGFRRHQDGPASNCNLSFCQGGEGSSLTNFFIAGDGSTTADGAGIRARDDYIQISNGYMTGVGNGVWIESDGTGTAKHVSVSNVSVTNVTGSGFVTNNLSSASVFINCLVVGAAAYGFVLDGGDERIVGGFVQGATLDGILVSANSHNVKIVGNGIFSNTLRGISIAAGATNTIIEGNTINANGLTPVADLGTLTRIHNNVGVSTFRTGQGTIASGATQVTITHGLDFTPVANQVQVTLNGNPTNDPGLLWVDNLTDTQFQVNSRADPGAGGLLFGWQAIVKQ